MPARLKNSFRVVPQKVVTPSNGKPLPARIGAPYKPVQIKVGITDGISTEVLEGLDEGAQVVIGVITPELTPRGPQANPFGGMRRF
jgi:multidrug efflux pump subunit AcrA (membrane-fusion protein)